MMELFIQEQKQCPREVWEKQIKQIHESVIPSDKAQLKAALDNAIKSRIPNEKCALLLSGGVDSSFLALKLKEFNADFVCYTIGIEGSPALGAARMRCSNGFNGISPLPLQLGHFTGAEFSFGISPSPLHRPHCCGCIAHIVE